MHVINKIYKVFILSTGYEEFVSVPDSDVISYAFEVEIVESNLRK
jgi:hypothetical protein